MPVRPEPVLGKRRVVETRADGSFRDHDDGLFYALIGELVERDEHQRPALARGRRGFNKEVLLPAPLIRSLLHWPHARAHWTWSTDHCANTKWKRRE